MFRLGTVQHQGETVLVKRACPFCDNLVQVEAPTSGFEAWTRGTPIQTALPSLSAENRELLLTGICPSCWKETFSTGS